MRTVLNRWKIFGANEFPRLMQLDSNHDAIVYFIDDSNGVALTDNGNHWLKGDYRSDWDIDAYNYFHGSITIHSD